ncbi:unnamed protein product [Rotaria sp. Silwood2]|nr:unnamed protein product [Rotaria sp. Silwood2]
MSNNTIPSMEALPVELLHRIFDNLDAQTIVFSVRPVCRFLRSVVETYDRHILDLKLISKLNFYAICRLIHPQNVISLILSNDEPTSNQIDLFISLVRLRQLTRLRSLALLNIDELQLNVILKRINLTILTFFSCTIRKYDDRRRKTTNELLTSIIAQSSLEKIEFDIKSERMLQISWPINCTIQYLTINGSITTDNLFTILQCSSYLHTIILKESCNKIINNIIVPFSPPQYFRQLRSLTMEKLDVTIDKLESFLLLTPSLVYLKLIGGKNMLDGKRWEQFIEINLPHLDKFEFYFVECSSIKKTEADLELIIASFRTPFWIEHKKWFVICDCDMNFSNTIYLYSLPICKSFLIYEVKSQKLSLSNYNTTRDNHRSIMSNVNSLQLFLEKPLPDHVQEKVCYLTGVMY